MYRRCPNCRKEIYIELIQKKPETELDPADLITSGEFAVKCPYCQRGFLFSINLMTEDEYKKLEAERYDEMQETLDKVHSMIGVSFEHPEETTTAFQFDTPESLDFKSSCICFTGKFADPKISRKLLFEMSQARGAEVSDTMSEKINVLVVGSKTSKGWIGGNYGTKIIAALERRSLKHDIQIISEECFLEFLK